jgi:signal transduction histidine kinase
LHRLDLLAGLQARLAESGAALEAARAEKESAGQERERLLARLEALGQELQREQDRAAGLAALLAANEKAAPQRPAAEPAEIKRLQGELTLALEEIARLNSALAGLQDSSPLHTPATAAAAPELKRVAAISAELNRPAQSIIDYAGRLLADAGGRLDEPQRRMLERIRLSGERVRSLVEDLHLALQQPAAAPGGRAELAAAAQAAMARLAPRAAGRQLNLRQEIPAGLPALDLDPAALERLLLILLGEAVNAAPARGEVVLQAALQRETGQPDYLLIQVANGGNPLPAARGLAEALHGRLWLDDDPHSTGSRANLLLPVSRPEGADPRNGTSPSRPHPAVEEQ